MPAEHGGDPLDLSTLLKCSSSKAHILKQSWLQLGQGPSRSKIEENFIAEYSHATKYL